MYTTYKTNRLRNQAARPAKPMRRLTPEQRAIIAAKYKD